MTGPLSPIAEIPGMQPFTKDNIWKETTDTGKNWKDVTRGYLELHMIRIISIALSVTTDAGLN